LTPDQAATALNVDDFFYNTNVPFVANFSEGYDQAATMMQPVGGMDRIAYAFADQLVEEIYYSAEVTAIRRTTTGVRIEGRAGDHITYLRGWQEGAVISGINALDNLLDLIQ